MADSYSLRYGGDTLKLKKSDTLIGVKLKPGMEERTAAASLSPDLTQADNRQGTLGGFSLMSLKDAKNANINETLDMVRANGAVDVGTHVYETSNDGVPFVPTGQLYLVCKDGATDDKIQELLDQHHLQIIEARGERKFIVQVTPGAMNPVKTAAALQQHQDLVAVAEPDLATPGALKTYARMPGVQREFVLPADELLNEQWHLRNKGFHRGTSVGFKAGADAGVVKAWERVKSLGNPVVVIAVIDDGFDLRHPDLSGEGKIVAPMDFTRNSSQPLPDMLGEDWHGTACAGVAVGNADSKGIVGAAPHCRLMPVRWGRDLSDREIENWFGWVKDQGAWVVSCSWGAAAKVFRLSERAKDAISRCAREGRNGLGCVICFAAGNDNHDINDPAGATHDGFAIHPDVIAVAACNSRGEKSNYSNFGNELTVCAPSSGSGGWGVTTTDVMGRFLRGGVWFEAGYSPGAFTHEFGGTSSACPLVAGICGLLLSLAPQVKASQIKSLLKETAQKIGKPGDYDSKNYSRIFGFGCIDADAAVKAIMDAP